MDKDSIKVRLRDGRALQRGSHIVKDSVLALVKGNLSAPIIPDPGNGPFGEHLNRTLEANATTLAPEVNETTTIVNINTVTGTTANHRRKRDVQTTTVSVEYENGTDAENTTSWVSPIDRYLMDSINTPVSDAYASVLL